MAQDVADNRVAPLTASLVERVLIHLEMGRQPPSRPYLDALVAAYTRHVPWESAFRIVKRAVAGTTADCSRWPQEFWQEALARGGGGTCYESNYAFFSLLRALGFDGYLTINDMNELCGCHSAIVVALDGERWLVDVGYPLYLPVPLEEGKTTRRETPFHTYTVTPLDDDRYAIGRDRHPVPYVFTLMDRPVPDDEYRTITTADYGPNGQFLDEVIVHKVIGDRVWRFNGRADPPRLESFRAGLGIQKTEEELTEGTAERLATLFDMDVRVLRRAFTALADRECRGRPSV